jgi:heme/copper-type cytochrome/quinol oxidase subunit 1
MPGISVWMLRSALIALVLGSVLGAARLGEFPGTGEYAGQLRSAHLDLMLFGWLMQFVLAVGYWMLPRYARGPERGPAPPAWLAFGLMQTGLVLAVLAAIIAPPSPVAAAGRVLLVLAALGFVFLLFPRIKPFGNG